MAHRAQRVLPSFRSFAEEQAKIELRNWRRQFDKVLEPDEHELMDASRVYLALRCFGEKENTNGLTVNGGRFIEEQPAVSCLAFDRLIDKRVTYAREGYIAVVLSSLILHTSSP